MKSFTSILAILFIITAFPSNALANNTMTAKNILMACTTPDMHWIDFCNGFFQAVHDQQTSLGKLCAPKGTTRTNMVELYEKHAPQLIINKPILAEQPAINVAGEILSKQFPCR